MRQQAKSSLHSLTGCAANSSLPGLFLSALRFMVAVIFKSRYGAWNAPRGVLSSRALASVALYFVGEVFVMGVRSGSQWVTTSYTAILCTLER
jgi:hypothetical protein